MRIRWAVIVPSLLAIASGCLINNRYPSAGKPIHLTKDAVLVFGRVQVLENGVDATRAYCDPWAFGSSADRLLDFSLLDLEKRKVALHIIPESNGAFYWVLPRGFYKINLIRYKEDIDPQLAFRLPADQRCVYIGKVVIRSGRLSPGGGAGLPRGGEGIETGVEDDFDFDSRSLKERFPDWIGPLGKAIAFPHPQ